MNPLQGLGLVGVSSNTAALLPESGLRRVGETRVRGQSRTIELFTLADAG